MLPALRALLAVAAAAPPAATKGPSAILSIIIDDMGWYDSQPHNPDSPTPALGTLASEGVLLERMYAYVFCSPTRRYFCTEP